MADVKKKKKSPSRMTTRERMLQRKEQFDKKNRDGDFLLSIKEGTTRLRIKSQGDDKELGQEIIQFYLGGDIGYVMSPATFDEPCPLMELFQELKGSDDEDDQVLAGKVKPSRKYVIAAIAYKDEKGKEVDEERIDRGFTIAKSVYQDIIELYLDEDEWGDMTDPDEGYDIKITRSGKGKSDTQYSVMPCAKKALKTKYQGEVDLEEMIRARILSYDEIEEIKDKWLNEDHEDEDEEEEKPKKKKKTTSSSSTKPKKKKVPKGDI